DETFTLNLAGAFGAPIADGQGVGTILNDDAGGGTLSVNSVSANEGNSGTTAFTFTVSLSAASGQTVTVGYATADGTQAAGSDYQAASGTLTSAPGETSQAVTVLVNGDTLNEPDETFTLDLANPTNATIAVGAGTGTIRNDDAVTLSVNDVTAPE